FTKKCLVFDNENKGNQEVEVLSRRRELRKRGYINYTESDVETNSESDYVEKTSKKLN
ncbi:6744_t:CDS:2, partial [Racocetra persica]